MNNKTQDYNVANEIEKLAAQTAEKQAEILLKAEVLKATGFTPDSVIVYSDKSIGFGWQYPMTTDQVKHIVSVYPINGKKHEMKFASSEKNFTTDSSLIVKWENSHSYHHSKEFKLCYESNGLKIQITVPVSHFAKHIWHREHKGQHRGFGRYEMFNDVFIDYFYTQSYNGGSNVLYFLEGAESLREYENFVITGEFQYDSEF